MALMTLSKILEDSQSGLAVGPLNTTQKSSSLAVNAVPSKDLTIIPRACLQWVKTIREWLM